MIGGDKGDEDFSEFFQSICRLLFKVEPKKPSLPPHRLYYNENDLDNLTSKDIQLVKNENGRR